MIYITTSQGAPTRVCSRDECAYWHGNGGVVIIFLLSIHTFIYSIYV